MKSIFLCLISLTFLVGCSTRHSLEYYEPVTEKQEDKQITLNLAPFQDERKKPQQIGVIRNLYGMPILKIKTSDSVPNWVTDAFRKELINAGYSLTSSAPYVIEGKILNAFADHYLSFHGNFEVQFTVKENDSVVFLKTYQTKENGGTSGFSNVATSSNTLKINLHKLCGLFITDLNEILSKEKLAQIDLPIEEVAL